MAKSKKSQQSPSSNRKLKIRRGLKINGWRLVEEIGAGGNGVVWRVSKEGRRDCAMKFLRNLNQESYLRFTAEIEALSETKGIDGVVPMLDFSMPPPGSKELRWLRMPLAKPFKPARNADSIRKIVTSFIDLAVTLQQLHTNKMYHRDIKRQNILYYKARLCFADFGLVKFPKRQQNITPPKRDVGPKFVMAPEMRRTARTAEGGPADIYSFMKTLWIAITGQILGFDGQYVAGSSLSLKKFVPTWYTTTLDELMIRGTDNDPSARPNIDYVIAQLKIWLDLTKNFHERNLKEWMEAENKLFPIGSPSRAAWTNIDEIVSILRVIADIDQLNHMFMPTEGGMTITGVRKSEVEPDFLVLHTNFLTVLKPRELSYQSFGPGSSCNYFRLEAAHVSPYPVAGAIRTDDYSEEVCEIANSKYIGADRWYDESKPLPKDGKLVARFLKGTFVIFSTRSPYNLDASTYDARHDKMTGSEFRQYILSNYRKSCVSPK